MFSRERVSTRPSPTLPVWEAWGLVAVRNLGQRHTSMISAASISVSGLSESRMSDAGDEVGVAGTGESGAADQPAGCGGLVGVRLGGMPGGAAVVAGLP